MLVLSRRANESIVVNHNIVVTVIEIRGDKVRIGIEAPREAAVHRREVYEAIVRPTTPTTAVANPPAAAPAAPPVAAPPIAAPPAPREEPIFFG